MHFVGAHQERVRLWKDHFRQLLLSMGSKTRFTDFAYKAIMEWPCPGTRDQRWIFCFTSGCSNSLSAGSGQTARKSSMLIVTQYTRKGTSHHHGLRVTPCCKEPLSSPSGQKKMFWTDNSQDYGGKVLANSSSLLIDVTADGVYTCKNFSLLTGQHKWAGPCLPCGLHFRPLWTA